MATEKRRRRLCNQEEIERALYAVAMASGNLPRASRELAETMLNIPSRTLSDWTRDKHNQRYQEISSSRSPRFMPASPTKWTCVYGTPATLTHPRSR
jgi:hypothetical protein